MAKIFSPTGEPLILHYDGAIYKVNTQSGIMLLSQFKAGIESAFEEDVSEEEVFFSRHDSRNYRSELSEKLTKSRDGRPVFIITLCNDYLV